MCVCVCVFNVSFRLSTSSALYNVDPAMTIEHSVIMTMSQKIK